MHNVFKVHLKVYKWKISTIVLNLQMFQGWNRPLILYTWQEILLTLPQFTGGQKKPTLWLFSHVLLPFRIISFLIAILLYCIFSCCILSYCCLLVLVVPTWIISNWTEISFDFITPARRHPMKWYRSPFSPDIRTFWYICSKNFNRFIYFTQIGVLEGFYFEYLRKYIEI